MGLAASETNCIPDRAFIPRRMISDSDWKNSYVMPPIMANSKPWNDSYMIWGQRNGLKGIELRDNSFVFGRLTTGHWYD